MTNQERQKSLDKQRKNTELGFLPCCFYCAKGYWFVNIEKYGCFATEEERQTQCLCAKAYNRMVRTEKK